MRKIKPYLFIAPSLLLVLLFIVYPVIHTILLSFQSATSNGFTWDNYLYFLQTPSELENIWYTLRICFYTVLISIFLGYLMALFIRFSKSRYAKWLAMLNLIPRFIPGLVAVYAMIIFVRDSGVIFRLAHIVGVDFKPGLMFNEKGIVLMNCWFNIPFATLIIGSSLSNLSDSLIESGKDSGASALRIFSKIILPLSYKDVFVAATFIFMGNISSFTTPYLMGANYPKMLGISLFTQFNSYFAYERAAALSVIMFILCLVSGIVYVVVNLKEERWRSS